MTPSEQQNVVALIARATPIVEAAARSLVEFGDTAGRTVAVMSPVMRDIHNADPRVQVFRAWVEYRKKHGG